MKVYEAKLRKNTEVESFSLVLGAAVETKLSKFAEEKETPVFFANEEKRIIYSVAMRPDKMIFRKDVNGEPANVYFTAETVEQIQQSYFKSNNKGLVKMNLNHSDTSVDGVYPIESWIVNNPEIDKSKTLFMNDVKAKDLIIGYKIDNDDVWENFVKTGNVDGLSVEAFLDYEIINPIITMNTEEKKSFIQEVVDEVKAFFATEPTKTPEEIAAEEAASLAANEATPDPLQELQDKYDLIIAENADLKEKLATLQGDKVIADTTLETMKSEKVKAETDLATFKAETVAIKNLPNEKVKAFDEMTPLEKFRASKN